MTCESCGEPIPEGATTCPRCGRGYTAPPTVDLGLEGPQPQRRLTVAFRWILAIPHSLWLFVLWIVTFFAVIAGSFAALVLGRLPDGIRHFVFRVVNHTTPGRGLRPDPGDDRGAAALGRHHDRDVLRLDRGARQGQAPAVGVEEHRHGDAMRSRLGRRQQLRPIAWTAMSAATRHFLAVHMTLGDIDEWTTRGGYARLRQWGGTRCSTAPSPGS